MTANNNYLENKRDTGYANDANSIFNQFTVRGGMFYADAARGVINSGG